MSTDFGRWLNMEILERGWSQSELARRGSISNQMVSMVITGSSPPGTRFCKGVAKALNLSVAEVMQRAGLLPTTGDLLPAVGEWNRRLLNLSEAQRQAAMKAMDQTLVAIERVARASQTAKSRVSTPKTVETLSMFADPALQDDEQNGS